MTTDEEEGDDNETEELQQESPGQAAKRARLAQAASAAKGKKSKPDCRSPNCVQPDGTIPQGISEADSANRTAIQTFGKLAPKQRAVSTRVDPKLDLLKQALRKARDTGDTATLNRFNKHEGM